MKLNQWLGWGILAAGLAGWAWPEGRLWGVHHVAFLPPVVAGLLVGLAGVSLSPWGGRGVEWGSWVLKRVPRWPVGVWVAVAVVILVGFRVREPFLGDGQLLVKHVANVEEVQAKGQNFEVRGFVWWWEPLETLLHQMTVHAVTSVRPLQPAGGPADPVLQEGTADRGWYFEAARWSYILLSAAAGGFFVYIVVSFGRRARTAVNAARFGLGMAAAGGVLLFFGYIEDYSFVSVAMVACLLAGLEESQSLPRWPKRTLILLGLAAAFHMVALILLPAVLYLVLAARSEKWRQARWLPWGVFGALTVGYLLLAGRTHLLPLFPGQHAYGDALLTLKHGVDVVNVLLLCAPLGLLLWLAKKPGDGDSAGTEFLKIAATAGIAFVLFFTPELGMPRDWDLMSVALWPLVVLGAWLLARPQDAPSARYSVRLALAILMLIPVPYVLVNANTQASIARFEALLRLDPTRSAYGWEGLAAYHRRQHDHDNAIRALTEAVRQDRNPRFKLNLGYAYLRAGRLEAAEPLFVEAARQRPDYVQRLLVLMMEYAQREELDKARRLAHTTLELEPENPVYQKLVSDLDALGDSLQP